MLKLACLGSAVTMALIFFTPCKCACMCMRGIMAILKYGPGEPHSAVTTTEEVTRLCRCAVEIKMTAEFKYGSGPTHECFLLPNNVENCPRASDLSVLESPWFTEGQLL